MTLFRNKSQKIALILTLTLSLLLLFQFQGKLLPKVVTQPKTIRFQGKLLPKVVTQPKTIRFDKNEIAENIEQQLNKTLVEHFLSICFNQKISVLILDNNLLMGIYNYGNTEKIKCSVDSQSLAFAAFNLPTIKQQSLIASMKRGNYSAWTKTQGDPRKISVLTENTTKITTHIVFWEPAVEPTQIVQLVLFYNRSDYFWHGSVKEEREQSPLRNSISSKLFGLTAGAYYKFAVKTVKYFKLSNNIQIPVDIPKFIVAKARSRFLECNYTQAKLFYDSHPRDNSSNADTFRNKIRNILKKATAVFDSLGLPFWLDGGTLLGWARQCDSFAHAIDVDTGIHIQHYTNHIFRALNRSGLSPLHVLGKLNDSYEYSFNLQNLRLDIFFFYPHNTTHVWKGSMTFTKFLKLKYVFPVFDICQADLLGVLVGVPCDPVTYVQASYGRNWTTPVSKWAYSKHPHNMLQNGFWSEKERNEVILTAKKNNLPNL